jgi:hypothetical protein
MRPLWGRLASLWLDRGGLGGLGLPLKRLTAVTGALVRRAVTPAGGGEVRRLLDEYHGYLNTSRPHQGIDQRRPSTFDKPALGSKPPTGANRCSACSRWSSPPLPDRRTNTPVTPQIRRMP